MVGGRRNGQRRGAGAAGAGGGWRDVVCTAASELVPHDRADGLCQINSPKTINTNHHGPSAMCRKILSLVLMVFVVLAIPLASGDVPNETEPDEWYDNWMYDTNHNRMDDRIEEKAVLEADVSIPVFVDYDHRPGEKDVRAIEELGFEVSYIAKLIDTVFVDNILPSEAPLLLELPGVVMVELNPPIESKLDISSPATKSRDSDLYSPKSAWEAGYTGEDIVIAVLDTGVDDGHESLDGKFVAGVDVSNPGVIVEGNPDDGNGHGTHCAGIAMGDGGSTDNDGDGEPDYMGTAPGALLVDVKISSDLGGNIGGALIQGMDWCVENKDEYDIRVLSISMGTTGTSDGQDATSRAANDAVDAGLVLVVAAGNDGSQGFPAPATADKVITVGWLEDKGTIDREDDSISSNSNYGPRDDDGDGDQKDELKPDVVAPGQSIRSCQYSSVGQNSVGYTDKSGTSMSAPHVAGIAALMLDANPNLTPDQIKQMLHDSAEKRGDPYDPELDPDYNTHYGWGIVDAYEAVVAAEGGVPPKDIRCRIDSPEDNDVVNDTIEIAGTASVNTGEIEHVEVKIDAGSWELASGTDNWNYQWDTSSTDDGDHAIYARAFDGEDYSNIVSVDVTVENEQGNEKPQAFIDSISPKKAVEGDLVTFEGHGEDDGDVVQYLWESDIDGELYNGSKSTYKTRSLSVGTHTIRFSVQDNEGVWSDAATGSVEIEEEENTAPGIDLYYPSDGTTITTSTVTLSWSGDDDDGDELTYDVYFDTNPNPKTLVADDGTEETYDTGELESGTSYYWKVIVSDGRDETESGTWSFTVDLSPNAVPEVQLTALSEGDTVQSDSVVLKWGGNDEDDDSLSYDVYLDTTPNPTKKVAVGLTEEFYEVTGLEEGTTYYWKVVVKDEQEEVSSAVGEFTVKQEKDGGDDDFELAGMNGYVVVGGGALAAGVVGVGLFFVMKRREDEYDEEYDEYGDEYEVYGDEEYL